MQSHSTSSPLEFWLGCVQPRLVLIRNIRVLNSSEDGIAQARQAMEDELAAVHLAICALHRERNALVPACLLPPEILTRIFLFCADVSRAAYSWRWLEVTRVCQHWRETALRDPHLWSHINSRFSTPWLKLTLSRAKSVPLSVELDSGALAAHGPEVFKHVYRIRDLSLAPSKMGDAHWEPILQSMVTYPARSLQRLTFNYGGYPHMPLPQDIFRSHAPLLRSIDLYGAYIPWSAPILCNLTHLNVTLDKYHWPRTSFDELLDALRRMPALETLTLAYCLPSRGNDSLPSRGDDSIVHLPSLRSLDMKDQITRCLCLTKRLYIPSSCALSLMCTIDAPDGEGNAPSEQMNLQTNTEAIALFYVHVNREQALLQSLNAYIYDTLTFELSRTGKGEGSVEHYLRLPRDWRISTKSIWDVEIATLCSGLHMEGIRHISCKLLHDDVNPLLSASSDQLLGVLRRAHALETLELFVGLRGGNRDFADYDAVNHGAVELPCLKTLNIRQVETIICSEFIKCLRLPSSCNLDLYCHDSSAHGPFEAISVFCAHANREAGQTRLQSLEMLIDSSHISIRTSRPAGEAEMEHSYSLGFCLPDNIDTSAKPYYLLSPVAALCHGLRIEHIRHLELEWPESWQCRWTPTPEDWLDFLGRCRAVEEVQFAGNHEDVLVFCMALTIPIDEKGPPFLQNVRRLALQGIRFTQDDNDKAQRFYEGLRNQLQERQRSKPIHTLCIQVNWIQKNKEELFKADLRDLRHFVPEIEWTKSDGTKKMWRIDDRDEDDSDYEEEIW